MASLLEKMVAYYAPHSCIKCSVENNILCSSCLLTEFEDPLGICYLCEVATDNGICKPCRQQSQLQAMIACNLYDGTAKELIHMLKFEGVKEVALALAAVLDSLAPLFPTDSTVVPIPTAPKRTRVRGYNQAALIAKEFARLRSFSYIPLLHRSTNTRQLGSSKIDRLRQAETMFYVDNTTGLPKTIILVDDVVTTGATINAAAEVLSNAGADTVFGLTVAKHTL